MNRNSNVLVALAGAAALLFCASAQASQNAKHQAEEVRKASVSLIEAIVTAEKLGGGKALSAEYHFNKGDPGYYVVKVLSADGKKLTRYDIDPKNGKVKNTSNEVLEKFITRITPEKLMRPPTTLTHAIALAQEHSGGRAIQADVDHKGDQLQYDIQTVKTDGTSSSITISGTDGKVVSENTEK